MDSMYPVADVARDAGVSVDRVRRTLRRLDISPTRAGSSTRAAQLLTTEQLARVVAALGVARSAGTGLSRTELQVLAALARAPRGVVSRRALARRAGVSPTTASSAVDALLERGLVTTSIERVALGRAQDVEMLRAAPTALNASRLRRSVTEARTATSAHAAPTPGRVPNELMHVFWNTAWNQLQLPDSAPYVARRLASSDDLDALAWGAALLDADSWSHASRTRGLSPQRRRLIDNLATAARNETQLLDAREQQPVADDDTIAGLRIASMRDLVAMKLKVIGDRGELRDYFDLMAIEHAGAGDVEIGLGDYLARYRPRDAASALLHLIEALAYLDDVDEDDLVPASKAEIQSYWNRRQPRVLRAAGRL